MPEPTLVPAPADDERELVVDGTPVSVDDLTFREQREMRKALRDALEDPDASLEDAPVAEFYLALIFIVKRRGNPELTLEDALDWKLSDFLQPVSRNGNEPDPTPAKKKA